MSKGRRRWKTAPSVIKEGSCSKKVLPRLSQQLGSHRPELIFRDRHPHTLSQARKGLITRTRTPGTTLLIRQDTVPSKMSASLAQVDADAIDPQSGHSMQRVGPHGTVGQTRSACGESRKTRTGGSLLPSNCHAATRSRRPKYSTIRVVLSRQAIVLCQDGQQIALSHPSSHVSHFFMIPAAVPVSFRYWQACYLFPLRRGANPESRSTMPDGRSVLWPSSPSTCVVPPGTKGGTHGDGV